MSAEQITLTPAMSKAVRLLAKIDGYEPSEWMLQVISAQIIRCEDSAKAKYADLAEALRVIRTQEASR